MQLKGRAKLSRVRGSQQIGLRSNIFPSHISGTDSQSLIGYPENDTSAAPRLWALENGRQAFKMSDFGKGSRDGLPVAEDRIGPTWRRCHTRVPGSSQLTHDRRQISYIRSPLHLHADLLV
jgi:hypothetical protein